MKKSLVALFFVLAILAGSSSAETKKTKKTEKITLPLKGMVLVIDPGHGERPTGANGKRFQNADPGTYEKSPHGNTAHEGVFVWDVAMRLKKQVEGKGGRVFLTLRDPNGDYAPKNWGPKRFPVVKKNGKDELFVFKSLIDIPEARVWTESLTSRARTANRIYKKYHRTNKVYFVSIHFDCTSPSVAGMGFYRSTSGGTSFVQILLAQIRKEKRQCHFLATGAEHPHACGVKDYNVIAESINPDSYLIELGNIRSRDKNGKNPDLWRLRNPKNREDYAGLITRALVKQQQLVTVHTIKKRTTITRRNPCGCD